MQRVEAVEVIPAPPDEVFGYLSDLDNVAEWQSGVTHARRTSDGPMGAGATAEVTREVMGQRIVAPLRITGYEPPHRLEIASEVSGVRALAQLELADGPDDGSTRLRFAMEIRGSGLTSFMEPMIASAARGDIATTLDRLRSRFARKTTS